MSKQHQHIRDQLCELIGSLQRPTLYGTVKSVDESKRTCSVGIGGIVREGVLLYAVKDDVKKGFCFIPKVGSKVLISTFNETRSFVSMFSEVDKVLLTISTTELKITDKGFTLNRGDSGLLKTLTELCDAISKLTVTTAVGASGIPINVADFTKIKQDLTNYLEG